MVDEVGSCPFDASTHPPQDSELWGELISDEEVESSSDEDSDEEGAVEAKVEDSSVPKQRLTKAEESGIASVASTAGLATPAPSDVLDLRKASGTSTTGADSMEPKSLYTVSARILIWGSHFPGSSIQVQCYWHRPIWLYSCVWCENRINCQISFRNLYLYYEIS